MERIFTKEMLLVMVRMTVLIGLVVDTKEFINQLEINVDKPTHQKHLGVRIMDGSIHI